MDLTSPKDIKEILAKYETRPSKGLGQNFLIDKKVLEKIIAAADLKSDDFVLEIGPGIGTLTQKLAEKAKQVIAIEKSQTMCKILAETLKDFKNVNVIPGDILKFNIFELISNFKFQISNFKLVANIPYYITSPIIRKFLEAEKQPEFMILMLQKEVAERICAKPGKMSLLAVSVQFYADAKIISKVSKNCFYPAPKVDSAIIKITPRGQTSRPAGGLTSPNSILPDLFFKIVKAGFVQPRKQLAGNLSKALKIDKETTAAWLAKNKINPKQRAETLSIEDWKNLTNSIEL